MSQTVITKKFMYVNRKAPYGTVYALESLEVALIAAAFDQEVSLAFLDDGVYQLMRGQAPEGIGMKNFSPAYHALGDYDITSLYVERESLVERGLSEADIMPITWEDEGDNWIEKPSIHICSRKEMSTLFAMQDVIFSF